jgi:mono/diheme cytochrome c family protein
MKRGRIAAAAMLLLFVGGSALAGGKEVFEKKCTICHDSARSLTKNRDREFWEATIEKMRGKGAALTDAEAKDVAAYLAEVAGPKK